MDIVGRKVESQVQFWALLGPSLVLLSIAVLLFKVSVHWYFPVSALVGIPLCVKWKMKGMVAALCCLFLLSGIGYQSLELDDRYWHVGLAITMAFSFIVLTLSLEEAQGLVNKLQLESQSRLDNFALLDEKWKVAEQEWAFEKEKSRTEVATLTQEVGRLQEDKQTFYKLAQLAKDELVQVRGQHDQLLQDLLYKKQQIAQLHERLEETEITIQGFVNSDAEKQNQALTELLASSEKEKELLKAKVALSETGGEAWQQEKEQLYQELQSCEEREKLSLLDQQRFQREKQEQQNTYQTLQNKCLVLEQERNAFFQAQTALQQQLEQMRHLEAQHQQSLQMSQRKLHDLETKLTTEVQQKDVVQLRKKEIEEQLLRHENQIKQREEQYKANIQQLQEQLKEQNEKIDIQLQQAREQVRWQTQQGQKTLEQEFRVVQERCQKAQEELLKSKEQLEAKTQELVHAHQIQQQVKEQKDKVEKQLRDLQAYTEEKNRQGQLALEHESQAVQERYQKAQEELLFARDEIDARNQELARAHQAHQQLKEQKEKVEKRLRDLQEYAEDQSRQGQKTLEREIQDIQEHYQLAQEELLQSKEQLEAKNKELVHAQKIQQQLKEQKEKFESQLDYLQRQLEEQKEISQKQLKQLQENTDQQIQQKQKTLEKEIRTAQELQEQAREELLRARQEIETKNEVLIDVEQKVKHLSSELIQQQTIVRDTTQQVQMLEKIKSEFEQGLKQTQENLKLTKQKPELKQQYQENLPYAPGNTRRIEGMYIQLKEQFQEKCAILDATRQELFHAKEELLKLQKEEEEERVFGQSINETYLQRNLLQLGKQYDQMQKQYHQETDELSQLVDHLLHQMSSPQKRNKSL